MQNKKQFWVVWCPGMDVPVVQYGSYVGASAEAVRLAKGNYGHKFYVLESAAEVTTNAVQVTDLRPPRNADTHCADLRYGG